MHGLSSLSRIFLSLLALGLPLFSELSRVFLSLLVLGLPLFSECRHSRHISLPLVITMSEVLIPG
jgi:hypothetical protein